MGTIRFIDNLPLTVIFLILVCLLALGYEAGFRVGRREARSGGGDDSQVSVAVGALFALSGFFLAMTFSGVASRFDARKQMVVEEANAIGTAYLRAELMPEPHRAEALALFERYVDLRLLGAALGARGDKNALSKAIADSEAILNELWQQVLVLDRVSSVNPVKHGLFVEAVNEVIDTHTRRIMVALARLPAIIMQSLGFALILSMAVLGYQGGLSRMRSVFVVTALVLSLSFVCILIVSLERPGASLFDVNQKAMQDLKASISR